MLLDFNNTQAGNNSSRPRNEILGFNCIRVKKFLVQEVYLLHKETWKLRFLGGEMAGDMYSLNATLCWVSIF